MTWLDGFPSNHFKIRIPMDGDIKCPDDFSEFRIHILDESILAWAELRNLEDGRLIARVDFSKQYRELFSPQPVHRDFLPPNIQQRRLISLLAEDKKVEKRYFLVILDADDLSTVASILLPMPEKRQMTSYLFQPIQRLIVISSGTGFRSAGNFELYHFDFEASPPAASLYSVIKLPASAPDFCDPLRIAPLSSFSPDTYTLPDKFIAGNDIFSFVVDVKAFDLLPFGGEKVRKARRFLLNTSNYHELAAVLPYQELSGVCCFDPRTSRALVCHSIDGPSSDQVLVLTKLDATEDLFNPLPGRGRICFKQRTSLIHEGIGVERSPQVQDYAECEFWHSGGPEDPIRENSPDDPIRYLHDRAELNSEFRALPLLLTKAQVPQAPDGRTSHSFAPGLWKHGVFRMADEHDEKDVVAGFWTLE
ncbi:hypothetical protein IE53DRAFT_370736 [Violaceomyces palustris]|uniref:Uncharacterized protein n=1 Tax=Violaceomyces palustris TaxID=1673888 RepID=A0ACD0NR51_9BASI|nr:hypothetical protein IE53DRAFT_370736 [Violaceomyces palustris]